MSRWSGWLLVLSSLLCTAAEAVEPELERPMTAILESDHEFDGDSGITLDSLSERQVEHLAVLGRVWGFLKYHHPGVTAGKWHWDYELFRVLPAVLDAGDAGERNRTLADWVARFGIPEGCNPCAQPPENAYLLPRLDWLADADLLGPELSRQLQQVHRYRSIDKPQLYVSVPYKPKFDNELAYPDMDLPDTGFRILALFRFWNAVIESLVASWSPYYPASNDAFLYHSIAQKMSRGECEKTNVRIGRSGDFLTLSVPRTKEIDPKEIEHDRAGSTFQFLSPDVAYIKLSNVRGSDVDRYLQKASDTRGLVIDIRNYPSDYVVFALGNRLVREPTAFVRYTKADLFNPGAFTWFSMPQLTPTGTPYPGKVAILVDEASLSQSEYTAMALRVNPRAVVVGSTTAGADGQNTVVPLPGGLYASFSGMGIFNPDKSPTQRVGILPDIVARPTLEGIREGRDEVLEAALHYILGEDVDEAAIREIARRP